MGCPCESCFRYRWQDWPGGLFFNVEFALFFSFTPTLLVFQGRSPVDAGSLVSLGMWVSIISVPLGGYLTERLGCPNAMIVIFSLLAGVALFLFPYVPLPALLSILVGLGIGAAGAIVALPAQALSPANRGPGLGIFYTWYYIAMALGPIIAGVGRDLSGSPATPVLIGGAMFAVTVGSLALFHWFRAKSRSAVVAEV
ncbi:MAG: MFS transporter [Dehalococcoidia bacterium]